MLRRFLLPDIYGSICFTYRCSIFLHHHLSKLAKATGQKSSKWWIWIFHDEFLQNKIQFYLNRKKGIAPLWFLYILYDRFSLYLTKRPNRYYIKTTPKITVPTNCSSENWAVRGCWKSNHLSVGSFQLFLSPHLKGIKAKIIETGKNFQKTLYDLTGKPLYLARMKGIVLGTQSPNQKRQLLIKYTYWPSITP